MLKSINLPEESCEQVLPDALHATRSLLCTATNATPHERFFTFERRSMLGKSLPNWLVNPGTVLLRKHVRNKGDSLCDEVDLLEANPSFAVVRFRDGRESTVSTKDLAPYPLSETAGPDDEGTVNVPSEEQLLDSEEIESTPPNQSISLQETQGCSDLANEPCELRRSKRERKAPDRYGDCVYDY